MKTVLEGRSDEAEERGSCVHTGARPDSVGLLGSLFPQSLFTVYQVNSHSFQEFPG